MLVILLYSYLININLYAIHLNFCYISAVKFPCQNFAFVSSVSFRNMYPTYL